jgi:hypothetical protein
MVQVGDAATSGEKELKRDYPVTEGTTAGTTKQEGKNMSLVAESGSNVLTKDLKGIR